MTCPFAVVPPTSPSRVANTRLLTAGVAGAATPGRGTGRGDRAHGPGAVRGEPEALEGGADAVVAGDERRADLHRRGRLREHGRAAGARRLPLAPRAVGPQTPHVDEDLGPGRDVGGDVGGHPVDRRRHPARGEQQLALGQRGAGALGPDGVAGETDGPRGGDDVGVVPADHGELGDPRVPRRGGPRGGRLREGHEERDHREHRRERRDEGGTSPPAPGHPPLGPAVALRPRGRHGHRVLFLAVR